MKWLRKNVGCALIVIGISLTVISLVVVFKLRYEQDKLISEYESQQTIQKAPETTQTMNVEEVPYIEKPERNNNSHSDDEINTKPIERSEYASGDMIISIPKIDVKAAVMNGTTDEILKKGPGLYEISPLPTEDKGNVYIAGHRTTYGAWFRHVDELKEGDEIILELKGERYIYNVEKVFIVAKNDWSVTEPTGYSAITLTACHPLRSSRQRIVVRGRLS